MRPDAHPLRRLALRWHVWAVATVLPAMVRLFSLDGLVRLLTPRRPFRPYSGVSAEEIAAVVDRRLACPRLMRRRSCLRRGLTLLHFLRLAGLPAELHVAVYPPSSDPNRLHAHCWVSVDGMDIMPGPAAPSAEIARSRWAKGSGPGLTILPK